MWFPFHLKSNPITSVTNWHVLRFYMNFFIIFDNMMYYSEFEILWGRIIQIIIMISSFQVGLNSIICWSLILICFAKTEIKTFTKSTAVWPPLICKRHFGAVIGSIVLLYVPWMNMPRNSTLNIVIKSGLKPQIREFKIFGIIATIFWDWVGGCELDNNLWMPKKCRNRGLLILLLYSNKNVFQIFFVTVK